MRERRDNNERVEKSCSSVAQQETRKTKMCIKVHVVIVVPGNDMSSQTYLSLYKHIGFCSLQSGCISLC